MHNRSKSSGMILNSKDKLADRSKHGCMHVAGAVGMQYREVKAQAQNLFEKCLLTNSKNVICYIQAWTYLRA